RRGSSRTAHKLRTPDPQTVASAGSSRETLNRRIPFSKRALPEPQLIFAVTVALPRQGGGRWFEPSIVHRGRHWGFGWWGRRGVRLPQRALARVRAAFLA